MASLVILRRNSPSFTLKAELILLALQHRPFRYCHLPVCLPMHLMISSCELHHASPWQGVKALSNAAKAKCAQA